MAWWCQSMESRPRKFPSFGAMEARLKGRGTETDAAISVRLSEALRELECVSQYEYVIVNRELDKTVEVFSRIIHAEEHRRTRRENLEEWMDVHFPGRAKQTVHSRIS